MSGKLGQSSPAAGEIFLGAQLPHQILNLKAFSAPLLLLFTVVSVSHFWSLPPLPCYEHHFPLHLCISLPLDIWHKSIYHINFILVLILDPTLLLCPWYLPYSCTYLLIYSSKSFTSVQLNYWTISWPPTFFTFQTRTTVLSSMLISFPMLKKCFLNS